MLEEKDIEQKNKAIIQKTHDFVINDIVDATTTRISKLDKSAESTFWILRVLSIFAYLLGFLVVIAAGIIMYVNPDNSLVALGFGSVGIVELLGFTFYKPMERLQKANADYSQQVILLKSWIIFLNLRIVGLDISKRADIVSTADAIKEATVEYLQSLENYVEGFL